MQHTTEAGQLVGDMLPQEVRPGAPEPDVRRPVRRA
jgi:hypothetical protein